MEQNRFVGITKRGKKTVHPKNTKPSYFSGWNMIIPLQIYAVLNLPGYGSEVPRLGIIGDLRLIGQTFPPDFHQLLGSFEESNFRHNGRRSEKSSEERYMQIFLLEGEKGVKKQTDNFTRY